MKKWAWSGIIWLLAAVWAPAQNYVEQNSFFDANTLNIRSKSGNTLVEINFNPSLFHVDIQSGNPVADLEITIGIRRRDTRNYIQTRHFFEQIEHKFLTSENVFFRRYGFDLSEGNYSVEIEVKDRKNGEIHFSLLDYECKDLREGYQLSDIVLEQDYLGALGAQTLLSGRISPHPGRLRFWLEVYAPPSPNLTCRSVLYKASPNEGLEAQRYASIKQMVAVLNSKGVPEEFGDTLDLNTLEAGDYLLEVYLERGNQLLAEESRAFTIDWKKSGRVFGNLDESIRMMEYVAPPKTIRTLLDSPSEEAKIELFQRYWEKRKEMPEAGATHTMEAYYSRAFFAVDNFAEDSLAGWRTDRGRIYITYGPPDAIAEERSGSVPRLIWSYNEPPLKFVFRRQDGKWLIARP